MKILAPIILTLAFVLSGCSPSESAEMLIRNLPVATKSTTPRQSGSMMEYSVSQACPDVEAFYRSQMQMEGWAISTSNGSGSSWTRLEFTKDRDSVQVNLNSSSLTSSGCQVQVFYHKYSSLDTFIPQRVVSVILILVFQGLFAYAGGLASKGKGRHPAIGWLLGFFLGFLGDFFILTWEPRRDISGRMIGWDEYRLMSEEQKEAIRQSNVTPPLGKRRKLLIIISVALLVIVFILQILKNLGRI